MRRPASSALLFVTIGLVLYAGAFAAAEALLRRTGEGNPLFKIATADGETFDWVILGASHAMPLDFDGFNATMERETGRRILNLAAPGAGPLYNRFVLEAFLREHRARNVLYVVDSFAFHSRTWNEERFADAKLLRGTPLRAATARLLWVNVQREGVDARALLDYLTGFSKINNRERFERDVWEGAAQFDRVHRPSVSAIEKRIAYLYPDGTSPQARDRYLGALSSLLALARREGAGAVVIAMPVPPAFRRALPEEAAFEQALKEKLGALQVPYHDFSGGIADPRAYFDSDHLNRTGLTEFFSRDLRPLLCRP